MATISQDAIAVKKQIILMEIGELDNNNSPVAPNIDALWTAESGKGGSDLELQYLFVKRKAIDLLGGALRREASRITDPEQRRIMDLRINELQADRKATQSEIDNYVTIGTLTLDIYEPTNPDW